MPAASRALLAALLLRAALGLSDDVLLLQQRPDGPSSRPLDKVQEPSSAVQGFIAMVTNDDLPITETSFAAIGVEEEDDATHDGAAAKPHHGKPKHIEAMDHDQKSVQSAGTTAVSLQYIGPGRCTDASGNVIKEYKIIPGFAKDACETRCKSDTTCLSVDFLEASEHQEHVSTCKFFATPAVSYKAEVDMDCWITTGRASAEMTPPRIATATGDPHVMNMRGQKFDIRRPGNHSFLVVPFGAVEDSADLYVWADVTPWRVGDVCKHTSRMYITELTMTGSWLEPIGSLQFSTGTKDFNTPETWGLSIDGSEKLDLEEFAKRLPPNRAVINVTRVARPHKNPAKHVDTLTMELNVGLSNLTVGWAFTKDPRSNWLWLSVAGLENHHLGGLLGDDPHVWATKKPVECAKVPTE